MSIEERRERQRQWRKDNPDKVKTYRRDYLRRKYLADMVAERKKETKIGKEATA